MLNKVTLIGRIGQIESCNSQNPIANYRLATTKSVKDKVTQQFSDETEWHRLVSFGKAGEHVLTKLDKGDLIYVEGELRTRKWNKNGVDQYTTEIVVFDFPKKLPRYFTQQSANAQNQPYQPQGHTSQQSQQGYGSRVKPQGPPQQSYNAQPSRSQNPMDDMPPGF